MKNQKTHPWIENYSEFEGVLVCTNTLGSWDAEAINRAFQIYQWVDATTDSTEVSFSHLGTGVIVRHDGNILAIDCGHGLLDEALPDLFLVLNSIGWETAVVYHDPNTIEQLLTDMGRAIPANMLFDVQAADDIRNVNELGETGDMVALGRKLLQDNRVDEKNSTEFFELVSNDEAKFTSDEDLIGPNVQQSSDDHIHLSSKSSVADFVSSVFYEAPQTQSAVSFTAAQVPNTIITDTLDLPTSAYPTEVPDSPDPFIRPAPVAAQLEPNQLGGAQKVHIRDVDNEQAHCRREMDALLKTDDPRDTAKQATTCTVGNYAVQTPASAVTMPNGVSQSVLGQSFNSIIVIGQSAYLFDYPNNLLTLPDAHRQLHEGGFEVQDVINIDIGSYLNLMHWDVLGELTDSEPWMDQYLASILLNGADTLAMTWMLRNIRTANARPQLRDCFSANFVDVESSLLTADELLVFNHLLANESLLRVKNSLLEKLFPLILCRPGQAFIDLPDAELEQPRRSFTVRSLLTAPRKTLVKVSFDHLDGPFVAWMCELLHKTVQAYATSRRVAAKIQQVTFVDEKNSSRTGDFSALNEKLTNVIHALQKIGVQI